MKVPSINRAVSLENLVLMRDLLTGNGIPMFLAFGTLLGAMRERDFIPHDDDVDVGVFARDRQAIDALLPQLESQGFNLVYIRERRLYKFRRKEQEIDLFLAVERRGMFTHRWDLEGRATVPAHHLDSLGQMEFLGHDFPVPADPVGLMKNLYGDTWQTPIPNSTSRQDWSTRLRRLLKNPGKAFTYAGRFFAERRRWAKLAKRFRGDS